ncbi:inositol monophosphatase family protein [Krasilnikovia sp. M28-CT-15]|uniref:inositol monophosphatase family protein n=1 Tax=Krasilnikovia sp. M28-CT-15 TaxID=3373540 RepID=UPI00387706EA
MANDVRTEERERRRRMALLGRVATQAAHAGAAAVAERLDRATGVGHKSGRTDPVTDADRVSERAIVAALHRARPDDGVVGEEGSDVAGTTGLRWVVDPLDGTVNYLYGLPNIAVSVGCEQCVDGVWRPIVGAVHDIRRGETFAAAHGLGARLNGTPITVNATARLATALVATGFSYDAASRARQSRVLTGVLPRVRCLRSNGSAALELCWVACGRLDAYYEDELRAWDTAAGVVVVAEAGGRVTPLGVGGVIASGAGLHDALAELVRPATSGGGAPPAAA